MRTFTLRPALSIPTALVAALALAACGGKPGAPARPPAEVGVVVIQQQPVPLQTELPGRTSPYAISQVRPQVNGIIQARLFEEGANVRAGQVLYRIDPAPYKAAVDQAKATLVSAQANLVTLKLKADRYADLMKTDSIARQAYDDAVAAAGQGAATVEQAKAALEAAQINLGYTNITAPIPGRIGRSTYTQGALVTASQTDPLTTIQTLDPIYVDVAQSSAELLRLEAALAKGQVQKGGALTAKVKLVLEDGATYAETGKLEFTDVTVDPASGAVILRAVFPNPKGTLLPGMFVRAQIVQAVDQNGILVPQQAVTRDAQGNSNVYVVSADNKAQLRPIQVSPTTVGADWLVLSGLKPGERVITEGLQKVAPDAPVHPVPAGSAPPAAPQGAGRP